LLLCVGASAFAQAQIDELIRKAEWREAEDGFCARTGWPVGDNPRFNRATHTSDVYPTSDMSLHGTK
jgi:hypothetical protein